MSGNEVTLGAVLAQLEDQEHEIAARSEAARRRIAELTAQLEEFHQVAQEIRITRKTLLALPDPSPPTPRPRSCRSIWPTGRSWRCSPRPTPRCGPGRSARRWTWRSQPSNVNNVRTKLQRLVERGILIEPEQGLFTQPRP
ncbi:hypothetical protein ACFQ51_46855 [Streptomyces kaempferi]